MSEIDIGLLALAVSLTTILVLYINRLETNRPIVTAKLENYGNTSSFLTLKLSNTGNTPAFDVILSAEKKDIEKALDKDAPEEYKKIIYKCLSKDNIIPIIHNNSSEKNLFGLLSNDKNNTFNLNAKIPITIKYKSIYKFQSSYTQKQILVIKLTDYFAGFGWEKKEVQ